ncbi:MAG TPA: DUF58 domain-containing protein, partial [Acidimicrobiales bacterium]|nr:DUF58 domain-containing protein [Acidimicrobiales bacterium]
GCSTASWPRSRCRADVIDAPLVPAAPVPPDAGPGDSDVDAAPEDAGSARAGETAGSAGAGGAARAGAGDPAGGVDTRGVAGRAPTVVPAGGPPELVAAARRRGVAPTRRLAVVAAIASLIVLLAPGGGVAWVLLVDLVLLAVAALDVALAPAPGSLPVRRDLPPAVTLGAAADIGWTVANPTRRSLRVALADELAPSLRAETRRAAARVPAGGTLRASTTIRPARRGRFQPTELVVRVDGPLGLAARQAALVLPGVLRVYPSFRSKDEAELRIRKARILEVGLRSAQGLGAGTEFDQLREYSVDDEFRRVDWGATARAGRPIVRTYRAERNQTVLVLVDNGRVMAGRVDGVPRVEHAVDAAMMLTAVATGLGDRCGVVAFDREVRTAVAPRSDRGQLGRVVEALYDLEPVLAESDYAGAFTETLARFRRRTLLVVLTDLVAPAVDEWLVPALPLILREHLVVVAGVRDPDVARWASGHVTDSSGAYRQAAAVSALDARRRTVARLRGLGVTVVDAQPGDLAPALADAYLKVKATGRL